MEGDPAVYIHALITPASTLSVNMIVELKGACFKIYV